MNTSAVQIIIQTLLAVNTPAGTSSASAAAGSIRAVAAADHAMAFFIVIVSMSSAAQRAV